MCNFIRPCDVASHLGINWLHIVEFVLKAEPLDLLIAFLNFKAFIVDRCPIEPRRCASSQSIYWKYSSERVSKSLACLLNPFLFAHEPPSRNLPLSHIASASQKRASGQDHALSPDPLPVLEHDALTPAVLNDEVMHAACVNLQALCALDDFLHVFGVQVSVDLGTRPVHGGALAPV